ncbi:MAG: elongation factor P [Candidatus Liptonbacteria bacterium]|nr:elongation factor P [Candidatus Liptonbacteria bacterium]
MTKTLNEIKNGDCIVIDGAPYLVLAATHLHMQNRRANVSLRAKKFVGGQVIERTFRSGQELEEADLERASAVFVYERHGDYWFMEAGNPKNRFSLKGDVVGDGAKFLRKDLEVTALKYNGAIITVTLPIKVDYAVIEAPPATRGNTAQGGSKQVTIDGGGKVSVPLFVEEGDIIRINTTSGEYVERVE